MAYKDKEEEKRKKREWHVNNPDKVRAMRQRASEKRRQLKLADPEHMEKERVKNRMKRLNMTEEELKAWDQEKKEYRRKYNREWARAHKEKYAGRHQRIKERMENDPEFAEKMRKKWQESNAKRRGAGVDETPEQRERRLQRLREHKAKKARELAIMNGLSPMIKTVSKSNDKPKEQKPKYNPKTNPNFKKPGRILAQFKWNRY